MLRWLIVLPLVLASCLPQSAPTPGVREGTLEVTVLAGPVCPVAQDPPDPECEARQVAGAPLFVSPGDGRDILVADAMSDEAGLATISLPPGDYILGAGDVDGLMGRPDSVIVTVAAGQATRVTLVYDTGIR